MKRTELTPSGAERASPKMAMIWLSVYLGFLIRNCLHLVSEKILRLSTASFRGDYHPLGPGRRRFGAAILLLGLLCAGCTGSIGTRNQALTEEGLCEHSCFVEFRIAEIAVSSQSEFGEGDLEVRVVVEIDGATAVFGRQGIASDRPVHPNQLITTVELTDRQRRRVPIRITVDESDGGFLGGPELGERNTFMRINCNQDDLKGFALHLFEDLPADEDTRFNPPPGLADGQVIVGISAHTVAGVPPPDKTTVEIMENGNCLDIPSGITTDGVHPQMFACNGGENQSWVLNHDSQGFAEIRSVCTEKCLDLPGGSPGFVQIQQYTCHGGDNQKWRLFHGRNSETFEIRPKLGDKCLMVEWDDSVVTSGCYGLHRSFTFVVHPAAGKHTIYNLDSGWCMDVVGESLSDGVGVQQFPCHGNDNQSWRFEPEGSGYSSIRAAHSGKCLTFGPSTFAQPAAVIQQSCNGADNQKWRLRLMSAGPVEIRSKRDRCLDVVPGGQLLQETSCTWQTRQRWRIE